MRAKILARFFVESHPHTLAERVVGANKRRAASRTRLCIYHLVFHHFFVSLTTTVLNPGTLNGRTRLTFLPLNGS